jgi:hypothetical protein
LAIGLLVAFTAGACVINDDASLTISNQSHYAIVEINISPVDSTTWGPDLLHGEWLYPGERVTIDYIDCDYYDVRIIDDTDWECIIYDVDFCFGDDLWVITDTFLDECGY